jgi:hypothetical protein
MFAKRDLYIGDLEDTHSAGVLMDDQSKQYHTTQHGGKSLCNPHLNSCHKESCFN